MINLNIIKVIILALHPLILHPEFVDGIKGKLSLTANLTAYYHQEEEAHCFQNATLQGCQSELSL